MKTLKLILLAAVLSLSTNLMANPEVEDKGNTIPGELQELLTAPRFTIEDDITVVVRFTLNEDHEIRIYSVASENEKVNEYLRNQLERKKLSGEKWHTQKLYEVPVRLKAKK